MNAAVMVAPDSLGETTNAFICGDDAGAKAQVTELLETFGWLSGDIIDLGDISAARGMEMYLMLWVRLMGAAGRRSSTSGSSRIGLQVVRGSPSG